MALHCYKQVYSLSSGTRDILVSSLYSKNNITHLLSGFILIFLLFRSAFIFRVGAARVRSRQHLPRLLELGTLKYILNIDYLLNTIEHTCALYVRLKKTEFRQRLGRKLIMRLIEPLYVLRYLVTFNKCIFSYNIKCSLGLKHTN